MLGLMAERPFISDAAAIPSPFSYLSSHGSVISRRRPQKLLIEAE